MIIALAAPAVATSLDHGLSKVEQALRDASAHGAEIVCFPDAYLTRLRGQDFEVLFLQLRNQLGLDQRGLAGTGGGVEQHDTRRDQQVE